MFTIDDEKLMEEMMRGVTCTPWVMDDEMVVKKSDWQGLLDRIAKLENEISGKDHTNELKTAEWKNVPRR